LIEAITSVLLVVGTAFIVTSSVGLVRLPDFYTRMHGPTKAATLGVICVLLASVWHFTLEREFFRIREVLAIAFIFLTAPVGAHMLSKAARAKDVPFHKVTRIEASAGS
jgi:monovalent cation/proton antiporter MnhG/PhaG subunit